ncbi:MAG: N-acetyl-gamma-glutamyl-phosphate reductase [Cyanobacteria bacterium SZAS TMP-1]|nr:N-acetyl-gamma-glutamyl-phosphate reductase [Cyanobacteria bacterium SZAS TMP-1]
MKKAAVVGASGYTGQELVRLLLQHDNVQVHTAISQSSDGKRFASIYPGFQKHTDLVCSDEDLETLAEQVDILFLALPHGNAASRVTGDTLKKCKVIDLGADFRLKHAGDYETWYKFKHPKPELLADAVYGLPELNRKAISQASLVANPGCYATCSILTLAPLLMAGIIDPNTIIIDAKSGVSGAGRSTTLSSHFNECNESIKAYSVAGHRHTPEIEEQLSAYSTTPFHASFTPHLVPMNRGILITAYATLINNISKKDLYKIYSSFYENELFIRLFDPAGEDYTFPETRFVKGSNFCDIGMTIDTRTNRVIAVGALDNLVKGAAGQAIQNMNLLFGWPESSGLKQAPIFPA